MNADEQRWITNPRVRARSYPHCLPIAALSPLNTNRFEVCSSNL